MQQTLNNDANLCDREAVNALMNDAPDGTYLVRDATAEGCYTLTLRWVRSHSLNKHLFLVIKLVLSTNC